MMLVETSAGLYCPPGQFHIDPWQPVDRAVITHAHGDHARPGSAAYLCAGPSEPLLQRRFGPDARIESVAYGHALTLGGVRVSFHPAGHVQGSAQLRVEGDPGVWVVSGDYKRAADPTCAPFEPVRCDTFITESTFGLPIYRWDPAGIVIDDIVAWWSANRDASLTSVLFCYTIGKAQRVLAELTRVTDRSVYVHGMMLGDDPYTIDAVLIYAQPGSGRRASLLTDYTFGVWDGGELVPIVKAYSGLSNDEIAELDRWIRRHTRERFGPVRHVEPVHASRSDSRALRAPRATGPGLPCGSRGCCAGARTKHRKRPTHWTTCGPSSRRPPGSDPLYRTGV